MDVKEYNQSIALTLNLLTLEIFLTLLDSKTGGGVQRFMYRKEQNKNIRKQKVGINLKKSWNSTLHLYILSPSLKM